MPNIFHAQDAEMWGRNKFDDWQAKFMAQWDEPETVMVQAMWQGIPEDTRAMMRTMMDPDMLAIVEGFDNGTNVVK